MTRSCPVCGIGYVAFRAGLTYREAYGWLFGSGRVSQASTLRQMARAKRDAWGLHLETCEAYPEGAMDFPFGAATPAAGASGGAGAATAYLSLPDALAGSVVPGIDASEDFGAEDWTPDPERLAFERDWTAREMEAVRILGSDLSRVMEAV